MANIIKALSAYFYSPPLTRNQQPNKETIKTQIFSMPSRACMCDIPASSFLVVFQRWKPVSLPYRT